MKTPLPTIKKDKHKNAQHYLPLLAKITPFKSTLQVALNTTYINNNEYVSPFRFSNAQKLNNQLTNTFIYI